MATRSYDIDDTWTEVTASSVLNLVDDTTYVVEMQGDSTRAVVLAHDAETSDPDPDDDSVGHVWYLRSVQQPRDTTGFDRTFKKRSGWRWWLRTTRGTATVVVSELD